MCIIRRADSRRTSIEVRAGVRQATALHTNERIEILDRDIGVRNPFRFSHLIKAPQCPGAKPLMPPDNEHLFGLPRCNRQFRCWRERQHHHPGEGASGSLSRASSMSSLSRPAASANARICSDVHSSATQRDWIASAVIVIVAPSAIRKNRLLPEGATLMFRRPASVAARLNVLRRSARLPGGGSDTP